MLPILRIIPYEEDEMMASWLIRLATENAISSTFNFLDTFIFPTTSLTKTFSMKMDTRVPFEYFWRALRNIHGKVEETELFRKLSCFTGTAPFQRKEQRQRYLNRAFNTNTEHEPLFPLPHGLLDNYRICFSCATEELKQKGYYYLHRSHHLPGVTVCHKHKIPLSKISTQYMRLSLLDLPKCEPISTDCAPYEIDYAIFSKAFMDADFDFDLEMTKKLLKECKTAGIIPKMTDIGIPNHIAKTCSKMLETSVSVYAKHQPTMTILMLKYGSIEILKDSINKYISHNDERQQFLLEIQEQGYELVSPYRNDIVRLRHLYCGRTYCVSPYGFRVGWTCPACDTMTLQEKAASLIYLTGNGEYTLQGNFVRMDIAAPITHILCGKTKTYVLRTFINEGVRCDCTWRIDFEAARKEIEKNNGFKLVSFERSDKPVTIRHSCGGSFTIYYMKFIQAPRCRVCERQGHLQLRTTEDFKRDMQDLTGEEYSLMSPYEGPRKRIQIRHNACGVTTSYKPYYFLYGARCPKCTPKITDSEFYTFVERVSLGRYRVLEKRTENLYLISDTQSDMTLITEKKRILQELLRPTPSPTLPLEKRDLSVSWRPFWKGESIFEYIKSRYNDEPIFTDDVQIDGMKREDIHGTMNNLAVRGKLQHLAPGIYGLPGKEYKTDDIIVARYLIRNGHRIGFYRGVSYLHAIGLCSKPEAWHVVTNAESAKTTNRKTNYYGQDIHIRGPKTPVTDENWLFLEAIGFMIEMRQITRLPAEEVFSAMRDYMRKNGYIPLIEDFMPYVDSYTAPNIHTQLKNAVSRLCH